MHLTKETIVLEALVNAYIATILPMVVMKSSDICVPQKKERERESATDGK